MTATKVDYDIEQEIISELEWELGDAAENIGVQTHAGVATLTGNVRTYEAKLAAQEAALRVYGITDVANELNVKVVPPHDRTDAEIARAVRNSLEWDVMVPDDKITSTVSDGFVTLRGSVEVLRERNEAETAVRRLAGVRGVHNEILVSPPKVDAEDLQFKLERALERRAMREANRIGVRVHDGHVTLLGRVQSWDEKRAIVGLVSHAPGVKFVEDLLAVNGY